MRSTCSEHVSTGEGLLDEIKAGRENLYINPPLLALLAERA